MHSGAVGVAVLTQPFQHPDLVLIMQEKPAMTPLTDKVQHQSGALL